MRLALDRESEGVSQTILRRHFQGDGREKSSNTARYN